MTPAAEGYRPPTVRSHEGSPATLSKIREGSARLEKDIEILIPEQDGQQNAAEVSNLLEDLDKE